MARFEVTYVDRHAHGDRDAVSIRMRIFRDGEYFQFATAIASGIQLAGVRRSSVAMDRFWAHFAQAAVELLKPQLTDGSLPLADPTEGVVVVPNVSAVLRHAELTPIASPREDDSIATFEL